MHITRTHSESTLPKKRVDGRITMLALLQTQISINVYIDLGLFPTKLFLRFPMETFYKLVSFMLYYYPRKIHHASYAFEAILN